MESVNEMTAGNAPGFDSFPIECLMKSGVAADSVTMVSETVE